MSRSCAVHGNSLGGLPFYLASDGYMGPSGWFELTPHWEDQQSCPVIGELYGISSVTSDGAGSVVGNIP